MENQAGKVESLAKTACEEINCRLYLLEKEAGALKVYVDKKEGAAVSLAECEKISKRLSFFLSAENLNRNFHLEVSSPGLERKLKHPWHFQSALNKKVWAAVVTPAGGGQKSIQGNLKKVGSQSVFIDCGSKICELHWDNIKQAKLCFEFSKKQKKLKRR